MIARCRHRIRLSEDTQTDEIELDNDDIPTDTPEGHRLSVVYERRHSVFSGTLDDPTNHGDHRRSSLQRPTVGGDNKPNVMSRIIQEECETMHAHQLEEDTDDFAPRYGFVSLGNCFFGNLLCTYYSSVILVTNLM